MTLLIDDENRVRTLTLNRPDALNAFNEALYDATADALNAAADDPEVVESCFQHVTSTMQATLDRLSAEHALAGTVPVLHALRRHGRLR